MDVSQRGSLAGDETVNPSMYFSFDNTLSSVTSTYKTLESSGLEEEKENIQDEGSLRSDHSNSTLEAGALNTSSPTKTVKRLSQNAEMPSSPLRPFPKNILKEFKAISSTPSKEQLLRSVDVERGSEVDRCFDFGMAFEGIDENQISYIDSGKEENADNPSEDLKVTTNEAGENQNKLISDSTTTTDDCQLENIERSQTNHPSNIDQKISMLSTTDEESVIERKQVSMQVEKSIAPIKEEAEGEAKAKASDLFVETRKPSTLKKGRKSFIPKVNSQILGIKTSARKSMFEPNPANKRPSRLSTVYKRTSLVPKKDELVTNSVQEIPKIINKMLSLANAGIDDVSETDSSTSNGEIIAGKPLNTVVTKTITSLEVAVDNSSETDGLPASKKLPPTHGGSKKQTSVQVVTQTERKPQAFKQRLSVVVKTTLNSPARKYSRKSITASNTNPRKSMRPSILPRRSVMPSEKTNQNLGIPKSSGENILKRPAARSSMMPPNNAEQKTFSKPPSMMSRKSVMPSVTKSSSQNIRMSMFSKTTTTTAPSMTKSFSCPDCNKEFRVKSLLDAHKQTHGTPAALTISGSGPSSNTCKFCDKKFALARALHIHLMQNCPKIPHSEKRKLEFTELNHVEKAQIPHFASRTNHKTKEMTQKPNQNDKSCKGSLDSIAERKEAPDEVDKPSEQKEVFTTPSTKLIKKKKTAHSGVVRTPSKTVPCHLCKQAFKSILEYTNHAMAVHNSS